MEPTIKICEQCNHHYTRKELWDLGHRIKHYCSADSRDEWEGVIIGYADRHEEHFVYSFRIPNKCPYQLEHVLTNDAD